MYKVTVTIPFMPKETYTLDKAAIGTSIIKYIRLLAKSFKDATKIVISTIDDIPIATYQYRNNRGYQVFTTHNIKAVMQ